MFVGGVILLGVLSVVGYVVMAYNSLVRLNRDVDKAWSNIDVLLKQRSDELPKLIDTAKEYMEYEEDVLQEITEAEAERQVERLESVRVGRHDEAVEDALAALREAAVGEANLMPHLVDAVKAEASVGEICDALRAVFGTHDGRAA